MDPETLGFDFPLHAAQEAQIYQFFENTAFDVKRGAFQRPTISNKVSKGRRVRLRSVL